MSKTLVNVFAIVLCTAFFAACRNRTADGSGLRHLEGDLAYDAPGFIWHEVPADKLQGFIRSRASGPSRSVIAQDSPITQRIQRILDHQDRIARQVDPEHMARIPRPVAAVLQDDDVNAFVSSRSVCVRQWIRRSSAPDVDPATLPTPPERGAAVVDLSSPGDLYETTTASAPPSGSDSPENSSNCEIVDPEKIGWNADRFLEMSNAKLPAAKAHCRLSRSGAMIVVPEDEACGRMRSDYVGVTRFDAQANVVFFYTGLLKRFSESSVAAVAAHELAHIYRAHASSLTDFEPYFFKQTGENELRRPLETKDHESVREAMLVASHLSAVPRTVGARFDADLFWVTNDLRYGFLAEYCRAPQPCTSHLDALRNHVGTDGKFDVVYESIMSRPLTGETRDLYLRYEELLVSTMDAIVLSSLSDEEKAKISGVVPKNLSRFFGDLAAEPSITTWFEKADRAIVAEIPRLRKPFEQGAALGLGHYSSEEEADEVGQEIAARSGINEAQAAGLWVQFMAALQAEGFQTGIRETSYKECEEMRRDGWQSRGKSAWPILLIDSLANIHHGLCYRLFNTEREWWAHRMDRLRPKSGGLVFDDRSWKATLLDSLPQATAVASHSTQGRYGQSLDRRKRSSIPGCIFAPRGRGK